MPVNKAAHFRFEIINECLRNTKKKWSKADLLQYINRRLALHYGEDNQISLSQLRYDLENMQSECGAPIEMYREGKNYYYRYEDADFSIQSLPVNEDDISKLHAAVEILKQIKGFSIIEDIDEVVHRLENRYKYTNTEHQSIISFSTGNSSTGTDHLEDLYLAIQHKNILSITYKSFTSQTEKNYTVHPYWLKEYNSRWYIVGYCEERNGLITHALDRVLSIRVKAGTYISNTFYDLEEYYRDIIGITKDGNAVVESIHLMFSNHLAPFIKTKSIHHSQKIIKEYDGGYLHIELKLIINQELINLIMSYGEDIRVLLPEALSLLIQNNASKLLANY